MPKNVIVKDEADQVAIQYRPGKFPQQISKAAKEFVRHQNLGGPKSFVIDPIVSQQTGIQEIERLSIEERIEHSSLEKLKIVQEGAYQAAYQLGLDEGREQSFQMHQAEMREKLEHFEELLISVDKLKLELVNSNEAHIVKLIYYMATRIAMTEIKERPEIILDVVRKAVESAQTEEKVTVRTSRSDLEFIEKARENVGKDFEIFRKIKLEASDDVSSGGCIIETNFGVVDASVEQRVQKLWETLVDKLPRVKEKVGE